MPKVELEATVSKPADKTSSAVLLLEEKLCREYGVSQEELRAGTITIKNGEVTVKLKEKKSE